MVIVRLPSMVAGRQMADALVDAVSGDLSDAEVAIDCRALVSSSPSFVAQLLKRLLIDRGVARVVVRYPPEQFTRYTEQAVGDLGVSGRVVMQQARPVPA